MTIEKVQKEMLRIREEIKVKESQLNRYKLIEQQLLKKLNNVSITLTNNSIDGIYRQLNNI